MAGIYLRPEFPVIHDLFLFLLPATLSLLSRSIKIPVFALSYAPPPVIARETAVKAILLVIRISALIVTPFLASPHTSILIMLELWFIIKQFLPKVPFSRVFGLRDKPLNLKSAPLYWASLRLKYGRTDKRL